MLGGLACNHGQTNLGKDAVGTLMDAATVAVATINTAAAIKIADKQYDIAKQYLDIAKWWRNYYNSTYKPWEDVELSEAWAIQETTPLYDAAIGQAKTYGRMRFKGVADKRLQCTSEYCTGLRAALLKDIMAEEADTLASMASLGYRNERAYVEARNDVRWQRRAETVKRGRDMIAGNIQFSKLSFGIFGNLGAQAGVAAGGALRAYSYFQERRETEYPGVYLEGGGMMPQAPVSTPRQAPMQPTPITPTVSQRPQPVAAQGSVRSGVYFSEAGGVPASEERMR